MRTYLALLAEACSMSDWPVLAIRKLLPGCPSSMSNQGLLCDPLAISSAPLRHGLYKVTARIVLSESSLW
jgi:hypothetical protein